MVRETLDSLLSQVRESRLWIGGMVAVILVVVAVAGFLASPIFLALPIGGIGLVVLVRRPILGVVALVAFALLIRINISTGTEIYLNLATLWLPVLMVLWIADMMLQHELRFVASRVNRPLLFFLLAALVSLFVGVATWDPAVPRMDNTLIVQLAQWTLFLLSAAAFWIMGNLVSSQVELERLTFLFLAVAGSVAIMRVIVGLTGSAALAELAQGLSTSARERAPFWMLLAAVAAGQLLFNKNLTIPWRVFLWASLASVAVYSLYLEQVTAAHWLGVAAAIGILGWLRWPRLRWPVVLLIAVLAVGGGLTTAVYEFAGGGDEWAESGASRLVLIGRVLEVTMHNPITGLGPAAYRLYAGTKPLLYGRAFWVAPMINSHNNYVDLFAQLGVVGMAIFVWFAVEVARLGQWLRVRYANQDFTAGYVNSMLAAGVAALVLMMLADWILPFVYNIGFSGFQASVLVWLFLGGLVALEAMAVRDGVGVAPVERQ